MTWCKRIGYVNYTLTPFILSSHAWELKCESLSFVIYVCLTSARTKHGCCIVYKIRKKEESKYEIIRENIILLIILLQFLYWTHMCGMQMWV